MPCSDSSSSIVIKLDPNENFLDFDYAKITCGREIEGGTGLSSYFKGQSITSILTSTFEQVQRALQLKTEDSNFILYLEWDAVRSALAQYLGDDFTSDVSIDVDRCQITSIEYTEEGIEIAEVILPPKEMPKILPCSLGEQS